MLGLIITIILSTANIDGNPEELGKVNWIRDYDQALEQSKTQDKPVFILFQEVPGCSTCKNYGNNVLSHPFIVEAIEDNFIPLVIYNNKGGRDKKVLDLYKEPTWNNPVVRIVDGRGENVVNRLAGNYNLLGITATINAALLATNQTIPNYLHLFEEELNINQGQLKESYVSMYCFWTGEKVIGNIHGVTETEAGFMDGKEVVRFTYNPNLTKYEDIIEIASKAKCADQAYTDDAKEKKTAESITKSKSSKTKAYHSDKEPKYYLSNSKIQYVPMTPLQAARINTALGSNHSGLEVLSPRQKHILDYVSKRKVVGWKKCFHKDFNSTWWEVNTKVVLDS